MQAHGIIQPRLDMPCAVGRRPVKITHFQGQGLHAALKVRPDRCRKHSELVLVRRFHPDHRRACKHIGADIQRSAGPIRRYVCRIGRHGLRHCLYEPFFREHRHLQSPAGILHALCIQIRTESHDTAVLRSIGLHSLEAGLCVLQHAGALIDHQIGFRCQRTLIPRAVFIICHKSFVCLLIAKAQICPVNILFFHLLLRSGASAAA